MNHFLFMRFFFVVIINAENRVTLNFPRLLYRFVKVYLSNKPNEALQYLYILSLYSPKQGYPDDTMVQIAKDYVCEFIQSSKEYKQILGVANGQERIVSNKHMNQKHLIDSLF